MDALMQQLQARAIEIVDGLVEQFGGGHEALDDLANYMPPSSVLDELVIQELKRRADAVRPPARRSA